VKILPCGDHALLCEVADLSTAHRLRAAVVDAACDGVVDVVPGWRTVLVVTDPGTADLGELRRQLDDLALPPLAPGSVTTHVIPVRYDGADLPDVAAHTGLSIDEVVRRHAAPTYTVAFVGFQPGFPYLAGLDASLATLRKDTPRSSVPAGAVGIAGAVTGIYPRSSPGGWQLVGRTDVALFDVLATPAAVLGPGDRVQFEVI
jgi:KipI family sensor histidine kinase inhibitor